MPFSNSRLPRHPSSSQPKTDLPRKLHRRRNPKSATQNSRRSAPARLPPALVYPETPLSLFLPLNIILFPGDHPAHVLTSPPATPGLTPTPAYDAAIARLDACVADSTITAHQKLLLDAAMKTAAQCFIAPGEIHSLIHAIGLPSTPVSQILALVAVVSTGMRAFIAQSGPSASGSSVSSGSRLGYVKTACASRDNSTCVITGRRAGTCRHIIPFSVKGDKAVNFWEFVAMFKGTTATQQLKTMALGPEPSSTDNIRNVIWLSPEVHTCLDNGQLAMVPVMANDAPYDSATATEYTVHVELPNGAADVDLIVRTASATGQRQINDLISGHTITLNTSDPATLPLPHPILLQLHTAFTRLRKMCAAAGIPILPHHTEHPEDEESMELSEYDVTSVLDYQDLLMGDENQEGSLHFEENDQWPVTSSGYPLKERYLQLLCGSEHSESEQYYNVVDHWTPSDKGTLDVDMQDVAKALQVMPHKRGFEQLSSASDTSRPMTEDGRSKRRWNSHWAMFGVVSGGRDGGSE